MTASFLNLDMRYLLILLIAVGFSFGFPCPARASGPAGASASAASGVAGAAKKSTARRRYSPWRTPTYADSTLGDITDGEDPVVRQAAIGALGKYNGSLVVADTSTGRILTIVNQKLAFRNGFMPCSTIKIAVALAALSEGVIDRATKLRVYGSTRVDMTEALAYSNNHYFENLGRKLGFEKVQYYARLFGLGEKAGLNIEREQPGAFPSSPPKNGGVGRMCSYGEGITLTPLQLTSLLTAVANGGTLYYLQYPRNREEAEKFVPRVKRRLDIQQWIPDVKPGMMGAVAFGTARRIGFDPNQPILGKTGTCTDSAARAHLGWFGSFNDTGNNRLAVVVMLTGGSAVSGPVASGVAGKLYKKLSEAGYLDQDLRYSPVALVSTGSCCAR